jgi:hypothetical protein
VIGCGRLNPASPISGDAPWWGLKEGQPCFRFGSFGQAQPVRLFYNRQMVFLVPLAQLSFSIFLASEDYFSLAAFSRLGLQTYMRYFETAKVLVKKCFITYHNPI